jgi:hypothetical protein
MPLQKLAKHRQAFFTGFEHLRCQIRIGGLQRLQCQGFFYQLIQLSQIRLDAKNDCAAHRQLCENFVLGAQITVALPVVGGESGSKAGNRSLCRYGSLVKCVPQSRLLFRKPIPANHSFPARSADSSSDARFSISKSRASNYTFSVRATFSSPGEMPGLVALIKVTKPMINAMMDPVKTPN